MTISRLFQFLESADRQHQRRLRETHEQRMRGLVEERVMIENETAFFAGVDACLRASVERRAMRMIVRRITEGKRR